MYIYTYTHTYVYTCIHINIYIHVFYMYIYIHICTPMIGRTVHHLFPCKSYRNRLIRQQSWIGILAICMCIRCIYIYIYIHVYICVYFLWGIMCDRNYCTNHVWQEWILCATGRIRTWDVNYSCVWYTHICGWYVTHSSWRTHMQHTNNITHSMLSVCISRTISHTVRDVHTCNS